MTLATVYTVFADGDEAKRVARTVIEERLAACANILAPCTSIYRWEGQVEEATEVPALFKTTSAGRLIARIAALHSYDVPAITSWPIDTVHVPFADWIASTAQP
jgi:periplasmic divalent cation tolerance protein